MFSIDGSYTGHETNVMAMWEKNKQIELLNFATSPKGVLKHICGPPFVSGTLHMGSLSVSYIKDAILRFMRMQGYLANVKIGFDCHGLPSENMVMKELGMSTNLDIEHYGIDKFIPYCVDRINELSNSWKPLYDRIGRTVDFKNQYKTIDTPFMESVWWIFKQIYTKGLIYKAYKVMPYSVVCETPLSNFEAGLNYKQINTNTVYVKFQVKNMENTYFVAWTTTPWTLPSNVALCVSSSIMYVKCFAENGDVYIVSASTQNNLKQKIIRVEQLGLGSSLRNMEYYGLFRMLPFVYHRVLVDDYVKDTPEIGTGIVHISPAHGEDDCRVCSENSVILSENLNDVCLIDSQGKFINGCGELTGIVCFEANKQIIKMLKEMNMLVLTQNYAHSYPHCYRSETPLIYKCVSSYFVSVSKIADKLVEMNDKVTWSNPDIGNKRFRNWLENAKDWCISRNRYFGTPLPVWESEDGTERVVIGSIDELVQLADLTEKPSDLHLNTVSKIKIISKTSGKILHPCPLILDCWFESGSVPYAQYHYPFENQHIFDDVDYLCDFVAEGLDQTRGWFYTLLVISTIISNKPPFKNVVCTGLILDKNGNKLSKKNGNYVDPDILIQKYGADFIRLYILASQLVNGEPLMFNEEEVSNVCKRMIPFINCVKFYSEQKQVLKSKGGMLQIRYTPDGLTDISDIWIMDKLYTLKSNVVQFMNKYHINNAVNLLIAFVDDLANWYVKISRERLRESDQEVSMSVLYTVLYDYTLLLAPFAPFLSEHCYKYLIADYLTNFVNDDPKFNFEMIQFNKTVHLCQIPEMMNYKATTDTGFDELKQLVLAMRQVRYKSKNHSSLRIPIKSCVVYHPRNEYLSKIKNIIDIVYEELNCLNFEYKLLDDSMNILMPKINVKALGQRFKKNKNDVERKIMLLDQESLKMFQNTKRIAIDDNILTTEEFDVYSTIKLVSSESKEIYVDEKLILEIDLTYDHYVHNLNYAKEMVASIQQFRKALGLKPWNNIIVKHDNVLSEFFNTFSSLIATKINCPFDVFQTGDDNTNVKQFVYTNMKGVETNVNIYVIIL
jgi:isoleucyl-tRNA synthetase